MIRLETLSPEFVEKLSKASAASQRAAALAASQFAVSETKLDHPSIKEALDELQTMGFLTPGKKAELEALVEELDNKYFDLQDSHPGEAISAEALLAFSQARAVAAVLSAATEAPFEAAAEAIYEAAAASDNQEGLLSLIEPLLQ